MPSVRYTIDARDEAAAGAYERFGALRLLDDPLALVLPLAAIAAALEGARRRLSEFATSVRWCDQV